MTEANRLDAPWGSLVDRSRALSFEFEGQRYSGVAGDTIASALAANDEWLLSRSFKYHRPRGVLTMAGQDANTLVQLPAAPNTLADREPIVEGLQVSAQNFSGSLQNDRGQWIQLLARFLPVGFYYHAFFRPRGAWNFWSRFFRKKAGLGIIDQTYSAQGYDKQYRFCDVAVIGGGAAGMQAAIDAANRGASVLLVDENTTLGGSLNYRRRSADATVESQRRAALLAGVDASPNIEVMTSATVNGWYADNWLSIVSAKRLYKTRALQVVLCSGTLEQPAQFRNNDLPGVMLGSAAQRLMKMYAVRPGRRAVVLAGNNEAYGVALDLYDAGVDVAAVVDYRNEADSDERARRVAKLGIKTLHGHTVYEARASKQHLGAVEVRAIADQGNCRSAGEVIDCDLLCMSVGFMPTYQLACQAGGKLHYDDDKAEFAINELPETFSLRGAVSGGQRSEYRNCPWPIFKHPSGKEFVDFDEDLQISDIVNATKAGYAHVQLVKRYSTCGMGPSQGRHSALATARIVADATATSVAETGVTTARPPFAAESLAHCAGRSFYPVLRTSMHHRHIEAGATMLQAGAWYRPAFYGVDLDRAVRDEVSKIRGSVGLIDVSTLGGIECIGPDAAEFLNRIYTLGYKQLPSGRLRYALMTNEAGVVIDDGVVCRLGDEHFYVTATTGGVDNVFRTMLQWNAQWRLNVCLANVTSAWCGINIAGPKSRQVLALVCEDVDLSGEAFPYLGVREGHVAGIPARLLRVGFVGELGYEIHTPQHCGEALWDALLDAGAHAGIGPVGIEAQRMLRLEKGHVIVGQDTDAMSNPMELQMQWAIARKKAFFVGKRTLAILEQRPLQRQLVGFRIEGKKHPMPKESHLVVAHDNLVGRVTSCGRSPTLEMTIGLAYVQPELASVGSRIDIRVDGGQLVSAEVVALPFYDPGASRQEVP